MSKQPDLSFWKLWNISFGFFGVQIAYALQSSQVSRIFATIGADPHDLSYFWILPPLMGLIVQPVVGIFSDRTWTRLGRRLPYLVVGALVAIIAIVSGTAEEMAPIQYVAVFLACAGVIGLGFVESHEDEELRAARQEASNYKYAKSWLALALPIAYCLLDAAGTFADDLVLETLNEDSANVAYELTFLLAGIACFIYTVIIKKQKLLPKLEAPKYIGACFETAGQLAYIYALASGEATLAAPIIASYCMVSVLWSRIFLKEKLSLKHYACIAVTFAGIVIMGVFDM